MADINTMVNEGLKDSFNNLIHNIHQHHRDNNLGTKINQNVAAMQQKAQDTVQATSRVASKVSSATPHIPSGNSSDRAEEIKNLGKKMMSSYQNNK